MDKKNSHLRQSFNKALTCEPRKSIDTNKSLPRNARRRENPILSNSKADPQRSSKPTYSKFRPNVDKRPRPRNGFGGSGSGNRFHNTSSDTIASTRLAEEVSEDDGQLNFELELNSVYVQGSKKQNLNHLLNFHYGPREDDTSLGPITNRNGNRQNLKKHRYNKEQFLQANFQFVINLNAEVDVITACPDVLIDWSLIEQINIQTSEEPQCPICLYPPVAAKLTRCGHVYCWPCILHYLSLSDKTWRKCPICYEAVHMNDLKSTTIVQQVDFSVGNCIQLQLMRREKGSMLIGKVDDNEVRHQKIPHVSESIERKRFSKFLLAGTHEILSIIEREIAELLSVYDESCPEFIFIKQALDLSEERRQGIKIEKLFDFSQERKQEGNNKQENDEKLNILDEHTSDKNIQIESVDEDGVGFIEEKTLSKDNCSTSKETTKYYYFYQSVDGQNVFLHPLNVKMLQSMYNSLNQGPLTIEAKILQKEVLSMNEELRKKFSCLGHLPLTCQFEIVEIQLEPPVVSESILDMYRGDLLARKKIRMRREREERKREKEINEINERQMGKLIARSANIDIKSPQEFPTCGFEGMSSASTGCNLLPSPPMFAFTKGAKLPSTTFATILGDSPKKDYWPSLDGSSSPISSPPKESFSNLNWRTSYRDNRLSESDDTSYDLDHGQGAEGGTITPIRQNLGDVIADALQNTKLDGNNQEVHVNNSGGSKKNKKKNKSKKTLLFSTGMNFNGN